MLLDYLIPYDKDGKLIDDSKLPTLKDALNKMFNGKLPDDPKVELNKKIAEYVDDALTDELFEDSLKYAHQYVRIARVILEDSASDAFQEICDMIEKENPLPKISQEIQDTVPVIGSYFEFSTYDEASKKVTTLLTIPVVVVSVLTAFFTILVVACKCLCCTKCQICMASCFCSFLCVLAMLLPVMLSLPNAVI